MAGWACFNKAKPLECTNRSESPHTTISGTGVLATMSFKLTLASGMINSMNTRSSKALFWIDMRPKYLRMKAGMGGALPLKHKSMMCSYSLKLLGAKMIFPLSANA